MKNFFTSVRLPRVGRGELGACVAALSELVAQLRVTINSIDLENMSPELRRKISEAPRLHFIKSGENILTQDLSIGDIVMVYEQSEGLSRVIETYLCTGEGLV